jgi:iron-sulfur cluster insertion protein
MNALATTDLELSEAASAKFAELFGQVEEDIAGIRIYAQPGGCSGMSFGMTFTDTIEGEDLVRDHGSFKVVVAADTIDHLRGAQIDFVDNDDGKATFVFNNIPKAPGGGCSSGGCGSSGGGCS